MITLPHIAPHSPPAPVGPRRPSAFRGGFTLVELLLVLALIVLALAAAVPAFNAITGSRSTDAAENVVAATLQRARQAAIRDERVTGVAFFVNPATGRTTMALVGIPGTSSGSTPLYTGWTKLAYRDNSNPADDPTYLYNDRVTAIVRDETSGKPASATNKLIVGTFTEINQNGAPASDSTVPPDRPSTGQWKTIYWAGEAGSEYLDILPDAGEFEVLPSGVGLQLINDQKGESFRDRYVQTGVILFDPEGRVISMPYSFNPSSALFNLLRIPAATYSQWPSLPTLGAQPMYSQLGLVMYDRPTFVGQPNHTEGDFRSLVQGIPHLPSPPLTAAGETQERAEEKWLDENTTPLFVNRYNGSLLRAQ